MIVLKTALNQKFFQNIDFFFLLRLTSKFILNNGKTPVNSFINKIGYVLGFQTIDNDDLECNALEYDKECHVLKETALK